MSNIKELKAYNLVDVNGTSLQLILGIKENPHDEYPICTADEGFRWKFIGNKIPMPVRSDYWFNGFAESIMLDWLKGNGWALRSIVNMRTGRARVYELPFVDEPSKGDEKPKANASDSLNKAAFEAVIQMLVREGNKIMAVRLYRYAHGGTLCNANEKVMAIVSR